MALDSVPWMVAGGAQHPAEVARLLAYAASGGRDGVITPGSMKVAALGVPGTSVNVVAGGASVLSRYPGAVAQCYMVRNATTTAVPITPTGSGGGRTDLVVARVVDPQYEGAVPPDPNAFDYSRLEVIEGVPASTQSTQELALTYPAVALARITLPASTATVTNEMITDVRQLAQARQERHVSNARSGSQIITSTSMELFSNYQPVLRVPEWATWMQVQATCTGVLCTGDVVGSIEARVGSLVTPIVRYDYDQDTGTSNLRDTLVATGGFPVTSGLRGAELQAGFYALRDAGYTGTVRNRGSNLIWDIEFSERVE